MVQNVLFISEILTFSKAKKSYSFSLCSLLSRIEMDDQLMALKKKHAGNAADLDEDPDYIQLLAKMEAAASSGSLSSGSGSGSGGSTGSGANLKTARDQADEWKRDRKSFEPAPRYNKRKNRKRETLSFRIK